MAETKDGMVHTIMRDDVGFGVLVLFDKSAVYEAFYRPYGSKVFYQLMVLSGSSGDGVLSAVCFDEKTGKKMRFVYRWGETQFSWDDAMYSAPLASSLSTTSQIAISFNTASRTTEHVFANDELLIMIRANEDDHKQSNRRIYVGNEDGTNMREVAIQSIIVDGAGGGARYITREGVLMAPPLCLLNREPTWNGERLFHCDEDDFVVEEHADGTIFVGLKW